MGREKRILLTGATGQIGWELYRTLSPMGKILAPGRDLLDLSRPDQIGERIHEWKPDLIVNPAAYTAVDRAESEHKTAFRVNAESPRVLAEEASRLNIPLIHYSTDYVFDGKSTRPYREEDDPAPLNVYGRSKLDGERNVQEYAERHLIFRTSWVFGMRGKNFLTTMLRLFQEREEIQVVDDQIGAPTWSRMIAEASAIIIGQMISRSDDEFRWGLYHLAASGKTTWFGFVQAILEEVQSRCLSSDGGANLPTIMSTSSSEFPLPAMRPKYSLLSTEKVGEDFGVRLPEWRDQLGLMELRV